MENDHPDEERVPNNETKVAVEAGERGEVFSVSSIAQLMADLNSKD